VSGQEVVGRKLVEVENGQEVVGRKQVEVLSGLEVVATEQVVRVMAGNSVVVELILLGL